MIPDFRDWFRALWGQDPFPWQAMLAKQVSAGPWPEVLDLPTASGKTACMDIAVYALAAQADRRPDERTAPRRVWFVVDRRIVVDEAFERASRLAMRLAQATSGPLREVADRLRNLSGTECPLAVGRLRGAALQDDGWVRIPSQPAVITSTVDQVGSRLLFRGYGHSLLTAPVFAGLAANDSLIILDEAHCAVPFLETLRAIRRYRDRPWCEEPIPAPFAVVTMSATPPPGVSPGAVFPGQHRGEALKDPRLEQRFRTPKPAVLVTVGDRQRDGGDPLVAEAAERARRFVAESRRRVAVMVNRVRTAELIARRLFELYGQEIEIVLLTGRLRPMERDDLVEQWERYLRADRPETYERPIIVVTTQCLEVGADFSFDALVTECASLDALRQRFGRLARLGCEEPAPAVILIRKRDADSQRPDWLYGEGLTRTWRWLQGEAERTASTDLRIDMGVEALESRLKASGDLDGLLAPRPRAPVLLPAHLDLLSQTAPAAHPEPDLSLFLHGRASAPDVLVAWRCDLDPQNTEDWVETVALCPPVTNELLQAPLWRVRAWLAGQQVPEDTADVEGGSAEREVTEGAIRPCLLWRGRDRSLVAEKGEQIMPGEIVVVPASYGVEGLGQATRSKGVGVDSLDVWEVARARSGLPVAVRLTRDVLAPWISCPPLRHLLDWAVQSVRDPDALQERIQELLDYAPVDQQAAAPPPRWWLDLLEEARFGRVLEHPSGGVILLARAKRSPKSEPDLFSDEDDLTSIADWQVPLEEHCRLVQRVASRLAERCLPDRLKAAVELAGLWHDAGKLDLRFQLLLHQGDEVAAAAAQVPIAKSELVAATPGLRQRIRQASGLPVNFRHEMVSIEIANHYAELPADSILRDLVLHLIASHHGYGRPFAPVVTDPNPPPILGVLLGKEIHLARTDRMWCAHRLDSGIAERFWLLTRHFGWWGLAYLEAMLRLADWYASNLTSKEGAT